MSSGIPSLTILSDEQKFNGNNLLQWKTTIIQLLGTKGLQGYVDGMISKPSPPDPDTDTSTVAAATPIYSTTPTHDEWSFRDRLTRGHITLNCTDLASLGVVTSGTAKEAWDSILAEWGMSTNMRWSHAHEALNRTKFVEGGDIQEHLKVLRARKATLNNLSSSVMSDETWRGIIIRSIPPTAKWLPVIPSLYSMTTSANIILTLINHGIVLDRGSPPKGASNTSRTALTTRTTEGCTNPNCKARKKSSHTTAKLLLAWRGQRGTISPKFWSEVQGERYHSYSTYHDYS